MVLYLLLMATKNELEIFLMMVQAPLSFHGSSLLCPDNHKTHNLIALEIMVDICKARSLKLSEWQLESLNVSLTFGSCKLGFMV
jgi:hypothetical protein